jgi:hypothetical protein
MNKRLEEAIVRLQGLSESDQELAAEFLLGFANLDAARYRLSAEQVAEVSLARREARAGKFASDAEMAALWRQFGL